MKGNIKQKHMGANNELVATVWLLRMGYEVFRNVSQHGPVDLVGMKDGAVELFDVKSGSRNSAGKVCIHLKDSQVALGVKIILVSPDGDSCEIVEHNPRQRTAICVRCASEFRVMKRGQLFCSHDCRTRTHNDRKIASRAKDGLAEMPSN